MKFWDNGNLCCEFKYKIISYYRNTEILKTVDSNVEVFYSCIEYRDSKPPSPISPDRRTSPFFTIEEAPKFYPLLMSQLLKNVFKNSYPIPYFDKCLTYYYCFWMSSLMYKRIQIFTPTLYFIFKIIFALIVLDTNFT